MLKFKNLDFSSVLASSIHDMKNSLGMVLSSLDEIVDVAPDGSCRCSPEQVAQLQYEAKRVNDNLVQLLTLYKVENAFYSANVAEVDVEDFLEECFLLNRPLLEYRGIEADVECEPGLIGYFDRDLVAGVINNIVTNAVRYTKSRVRLAASSEDGYLRLSVDDDGSGFPPRMLEADFSSDGEIDVVSGRTKLGLVFCSMVAGLHENEGREGYIKLENGGVFGGGRFTVFLP